MWNLIYGKVKVMPSRIFRYDSDDLIDKGYAHESQGALVVDVSRGQRRQQETSTVYRKKIRRSSTLCNI